ncbi:MAG: dienelactone hydrolase [Gammaproteobacteria bacterium]|nr:dienelactone hydrolase [Gammaproteobacteria bacterium]|tara:strand:+ start:3193 stop:4485 length:1293 start_codon:yes stop_codon:yes gene_type:complete
MRILIVSLLMSLISSTLHAQTNRIDLIRPDAPELAHFGELDVGVRTVEVTDSDRPDVLNMRRDEETPLYDRSLTLEIWYPAQLSAGQTPGTQYQARTRNVDLIATLHGRAVRDADPLRSDTRFPLIIISHGYPGNRYLLSHLGENLASKGYVVASIDHRDSTYEDQQNINSTLYNRAMDQRFVLSAIADFGADNNHFLGGLVDADNTGLIGYSMGGFGAVNNLGAGYSDAGVGFIAAPPNGLLNELAASNPDFSASVDPRIKAGVPIAPWGMNTGFWDADGLAGIRAPTLFVAGDADTTSGYENGIKAIYDGAVNSDRYMLVFKNAGHSAAAPIPLPVEFLDREDTTGASHYTDPVWDTLRMNNILQHFVTAFLDLHLKGEGDKAAYLDVVEDGADGVYAMNPDGQARANHTYWRGFGQGSAVGLKLYRN